MVVGDNDTVGVDIDVIIERLFRHSIIVLALRRCGIEICCLSKQDLEMCTPPTDVGVMPLFVAHLLNHYHLLAAEARENVATAPLNLSIFAHEMLMCPLSILDALIITLRRRNNPL